MKTLSQVPAGCSNAGVPEVWFLRPYEIIGNRQQNGEIGTYQGIAPNPEVIYFHSFRDLNSLSKFYVAIWLLSFV